MPRVSVIIPCYNHGAYLAEAVESVLSQTFQDVEVIVVNDGSTDELTNYTCSNYAREKVSVITTTNQGLAAARNTGIAAAAGQYILPLDADDRIDTDYTRQAVAVLDSDQEVGIVYCHARLFGAVETDWLLPEYSLEEMLKDNVIFCSAFFRKSDWELVGGYDPEMIYGWEDYDFWLSLIERGRQVKQLPGAYFHYRVNVDSMVRTKEKWQKIKMFKRIYQRHNALIGSHIEVWLKELIETRERYFTSRLYVDCGRGVSDQDSVVQKIEPGTKVIVFTVTSFKARRAFRFDPVECPVCVRLHSISLEGDNGSHEYDLSSLTSNALFLHDNYFMFDSADPQIFLHLPEDKVKYINTLVFTLEYSAFEAEALREIVELQKRLMGKRKNHLVLPKWLSLNKTS